MLLELYDLGVETRVLHVFVGLALGLVFGAAAQISRFCLRRAIAGPQHERGQAGAIWLTALATAVLGFAGASALGLVDLSDHRYHSANLPLVAIVIGGLAFGAGMILTRGCVSRLTVLSGTGNLRALLVLLVFAITAHATIKGVLAPVRTYLGLFAVEAPLASLAVVPLGVAALFLPISALAAYLAWRTRPGALNLALAATIGLIAVGGWVFTSVLLADEFDPLPVQSAAFAQPWSETLFWAIASSAIPAGFGVGFIVGVLGGSFLSAAVRGEIKGRSFERSGQTLRYMAGGALMGFGGVLAGGCTVGAGLSGVASGSVAALIALASISFGAWATAAGAMRGTRPALAEV